MSADAYEYRVIRRFPDEENPADREVILLPPTEDRRRATSVHAMESEDEGGVEFQMRRVGPWERVMMPDERLRDTMFAPRDRPSVPPVDVDAHADPTPATKSHVEATRTAVSAVASSSLGGKGAGDV